jgi:hypothetical protein
MKNRRIFAAGIFILLMAFSFFQSDVWAENFTLGIPDGTYTGGGTLIKDKWLLRGLVRVPFTSTRKLENGELTARSVGRILWLFKKAVHAHLRFTPLVDEPGKYNVYDLDSLDEAGAPKLVGSAFPTDLGYVNNNSMMNGSIEVLETWVPNGDGKGFRVANASQCDKILGRMIYSASFRKN